jgi:gamma-tubulin complex component 2
MRTNLASNTDDIKAVLEAQRAKIAALQRTREQRNDAVADERSGLKSVKGDSRTVGATHVSEKIQTWRDGGDRKATFGDGENAGSLAIKGCLDEVVPFVGGTPDYPVGTLFQQDIHSERLSFDFFDRCAVAGEPGFVPSLAVPARMQEALLAEDLLHSFAGFQGNWVVFQLEKDEFGRPCPTYRFEAEGDIDPSVREMVLKMLPLSKYIAMVRRFADTKSGSSSGLIVQALAGSMRGMLLDWELMLAQVESQLRSENPATTFTLQALWYYIQSPMAAFHLVAKIASDVCSRNMRGASILSYLDGRADEVIGDPLASKFLSRILTAVTAPYFSMLELWICHGIIDDPYGEFVVIGNDALAAPCRSGNSSGRLGSSSSYWTDKFRVRTKDSTGAPDVPSFLKDSLKEILNTGKYLDLIRSCGNVFDSPLGKGVKLEYDEDGKYLLRIREAYQAACAASVDIIHKHKVLHGLEGLRKYFLTAQGDLFLAFMDAGDIDLRSTNIPMQQLQDVLQLSIQGSSASADPVASSLEIVYGSKSLHQLMLDLTRNARAAEAKAEPSVFPTPQLKPIHSMSVSNTERSKIPARNLAMLYYHIPWPLAVISPDTAVAQYQAFFKHLFDLKWVERELCKTCKLYQVTRSLANFERRASRRESVDSKGASPAKLSNPAMRNLMLAYNTCQSMMHFFREYLLYSSFELLDPLWKALECSLKKSENVDDMAAHHMVFLEKAMKGLFLSRKLKLPPALFKVEEIALDFVKLSFDHMNIDYAALDRAAASCGGSLLERQRFKARRIRAMMDASLTNSQYESQLKDLSLQFKMRCRDFLMLLVDAYEDSKRGTGRKKERDDLESLANLIDRLDGFNRYYTV